MGDLPNLPKSEMQVARIVWRLGEASVRQVFEALPSQRDLDFYTVQTYLRRLEAKGYLKKRRDGRTNVYLPAVKPQRVIRQVVDDVVDRLFDGNSMPLVQHLIDERNLTKADLDALQAKLDELKTRSRKG
ncbi:MAG: BlaI/MecI/CopY family transcriptional regulator [Planctomycetales bacterium]|nr:BlaI/MecI/CopY family transcriptional regulator [Planctomycetales bacterium]